MMFSCLATCLAKQVLDICKILDDDHEIDGKCLLMLDIINIPSKWSFEIGESVLD